MGAGPGVAPGDSLGMNQMRRPFSTPASRHRPEHQQEAEQHDQDGGRPGTVSAAGTVDFEVLLAAWPPPKLPDWKLGAPLDLGGLGGGVDAHQVKRDRVVGFLFPGRPVEVPRAAPHPDRLVGLLRDRAGHAGLEQESEQKLGVRDVAQARVAPLRVGLVVGHISVVRDRLRGLSWGNRPHFGADQPRRSAPAPRR